MKKKLLVLSATLMALTSCDISDFNIEELFNKETDSSQDSSDSSVSSDITFDFNETVDITIYTSLSSSASYGLTFDAYLEKFEELYPNINVTHTRCGGYDDVRDQIKTELPSGQGPNLAYCYSDHIALYNKSRQVQTLDKFINNTQKDENGNLIFGLTEAQKSDFIESYYEDGKSFGDGLLYSLPLYKSTEVLYYNEDIFEDLGLEVPTHWFKDDEGLDEKTSMEYVCEKLKQYNPNCTPLGYDTEANWFITMCEQYGSSYTSATGEHFLFNNETNKNFVRRFKEWYDNGLVTTQNIYGSYTSALFTNVADDDTNRTYMNIGSSAGAVHQSPTCNEDGSYPFSVGVASIPQVNPNNPKTISEGPSICIFKKDNKAEVIASWLLLRYLTTNVTFQATMSMQSGYVPAIKSVYNNETYSEWLDMADGNEYIAARSAQVCRKQSSMYFTSPAFIGSSAARDEVETLMVSVFLNTQSIDEAFTTAINACKEATK